MELTRRSFLKLAAAAAPLSFPRTARAAKPATRMLGRTKLAVSELGMGVMITPNPEVVRAALDAGVTYFDTARVYMGGRNEAILAEGLGTRRREVVVATKCKSYGSAASIAASCEESLAALKTDWIDVFQLHGLSSRKQVLAPESLEGLAALKKSGKIRFAGVTTHAGMVEVIDAVIESGAYDTVLTTYNFREPPGLGAAVRRAAAAGVGVIAMKVMAGGYRDAAAPALNPFQGALRCSGSRRSRRRSRVSSRSSRSRRTSLPRRRRSAPATRSRSSCTPPPSSPGTAAPAAAAAGSARAGRTSPRSCAR